MKLYECQECEKVSGDINAHHIRFWSEFPEGRFRVGNGITLCVPCHRYVHRIERLNKKALLI